MKHRFNQGKRNNLNFYRDSLGNEIDVIYRIAQHVLAIEVKAGETVVPDYFKGFRVFENGIPDLPLGKVVVYGGSREETRKDIKIVQVHHIHKILDDLS